MPIVLKYPRNPQGLFRLERRLLYLLLLCDIFKLVMHYRISYVCVPASLLLLALKTTVAFALSFFKKRLVIQQNWRVVKYMYLKFLFRGVLYLTQSREIHTHTTHTHTHTPHTHAQHTHTHTHTYQYSCCV